MQTNPEKQSKPMLSYDLPMISPTHQMFRLPNQMSNKFVDLTLFHTTQVPKTGSNEARNTANKLGAFFDFLFLSRFVNCFWGS